MKPVLEEIMVKKIVGEESHEHKRRPARADDISVGFLLDRGLPDYRSKDAR
jgi:hypothetical protein